MLLMFGFILMVLGTYANLLAIDESKSSIEVEQKLDHHITNDIDLKGPVNISEILKPPKFPLNEALPNSNLKDPIVKEINLEEEGETNKQINKMDKPDDVEKSTPKSDLLINLLNERHKKEAAADGAAYIVGAPNDTKKISEEINKDAIAHEQHEIEIENLQQSQIKEEIGKLKETKDVLAAEVQDMKEQLNEETKLLVLKKLENINEKIVGIEEKQEAVAKAEAIRLHPVAQNETRSKVNDTNKQNPVLQLLIQKTTVKPLGVPENIQPNVIQPDKVITKENTKSIPNVPVVTVLPAADKIIANVTDLGKKKVTPIVVKIVEPKIGRDLLNALDKSMETTHARIKRDVDENCVTTSTLDNSDVIIKSDKLSVPEEDHTAVKFEENNAIIFGRDLKSVNEMNGTIS